MGRSSVSLGTVELTREVRLCIIVIGRVQSRKRQNEGPEMSRRWRGLVSILSMAAFLIANTPASAVAVRCPWVLSSKRPCTASDSEPSNSTCSSCCCSPSSDSVRVPQPVQASQPASDDAPACPHCPGVPSCPYGCCWCSVTKVPCCVGAFQIPVGLARCLGSLLIEASLLIPPAPCAELMRPPRA